MKRCYNITLQEFGQLLRDAGFSISTDKLKAAIRSGYFGSGIAEVKLKQDEYLIPKKDATEWIDAHSMEEEIDQIYLDCVKNMRKVEIA